MADPRDTNRVNVDGTLNVLVAARDAKVKRVVFAGSTAVYGDTPTLPTKEETPPAPISPYGASKLAGEIYGQVFGRSYGLEFVSLRYFNVFGPGRIPVRLIPACFRGSMRRFWMERSRSYLATANSRATLYTSETWPKPICWLAKRKAPRDSPSTWALETDTR